MLDGGGIDRQGREVVQQVFGRGRHGAGRDWRRLGSPSRRPPQEGQDDPPRGQTRLVRQMPIASIFRHQPNPS